MKLDKMDFFNIFMFVFLWYISNIGVMIRIFLAFLWGGASTNRRQKNA